MPKSIFSESQEKLQTLLREARQNAGFNQTELAEKLGRPQSFVSKYESGERRLDIIELLEVCRAMDISLSSFVKQLEK